MATLVCFGFGYCAEHFVESFGDKFDRIIGTVRTAERAAILNAYNAGRVRTVLFDGAPTAELQDLIAEAAFVLVSAPPGDNGDPVIAACGDLFAQSRAVQSIVYLSTIGVYGDQRGAWVDEQTPPQPESPRARQRLAAEQAWSDLGAGNNVSVAILRLAGIYGPGQNALIQAARGKAHRVIKPGQIFNRIHVADIAQAIDAAFARKACGLFNVADDAPSPPADPIDFAARLLGIEPPAAIAFDAAAPSMSPMALSFWQECRRVRNDKLKRELGVVLRYPTYREGLRALFEDGWKIAQPTEDRRT